MLGVDQDERAPLLQHSEDRTPEHPRTLHGDLPHVVEGEPVTQRQQIGGHRPKGAHEPLAGAVSLGQQHAGHYRLLVDIQAATAWRENLPAPMLLSLRQPASGARETTRFACVLTSLGRGDSHSSGKRTRISFVIGLAAPKRHDLVSLAPPPSMSPPGPIFIRFHVWSGTDIALRSAAEKSVFSP
jgi:hypothetical protein